MTNNKIMQTNSQTSMPALTKPFQNKPIHKKTQSATSIPKRITPKYIPQRTILQKIATDAWKTNNLFSDINLRGYTFEYIAKILLRREKHNNFIFQSNQFDNLNEILTKYRLKTDKIQTIISENSNKVLSQFQKIKGDLIEFVLDDVTNRQIQQIIIYDVKTCYVQTTQLEMCYSDKVFFEKIKQDKSGLIKSQAMLIFMQDHWQFQYTLCNFDEIPIRVYSRYQVK